MSPAQALLIRLVGPRDGEHGLKAASFGSLRLGAAPGRRA